MKKAILIFALAASVVFSSFGALAKDYPAIKDKDGNYSYSVTVDLKEFLGEQKEDSEFIYGESMYGLVAIVGTENAKIEDGNIVYIDQATSTEDGKLIFDKFLPYGPLPIEPEDDGDVTLATEGEPGTGTEPGTEPDTETEGEVEDPVVNSEIFKECTLFIGGDGFDGAKQIGVLKAATSAVSVTCNVKDSDLRTGFAIVTVKDSNGEIVVDSFESSVSSGAFTVDMPTGTGYTFEFTKTNYCKYVIEGVDISGNDDLPVADLTTLAGNANGTDGIDGYDIDKILGNFGAINSEYDVTGDKNINGFDLDAVLGNFGRPAVVKHKD